MVVLRLLSTDKTCVIVGLCSKCYREYFLCVGDYYDNDSLVAAIQEDIP